MSEKFPLLSYISLTLPLITGGPPSAFDPDQYIDMCLRYYPTAVLSIGWTTSLYVLPTTYAYTSEMIDEVRWWVGWVVDAGTRSFPQQMAALLRRKNLLSHPITFPLSIVSAMMDPSQMVKLLSLSPTYTLTFWGPADQRVRAWARDFYADRVYVDVHPGPWYLTLSWHLYRAVGLMPTRQ